MIAVAQHDSSVVAGLNFWQQRHAALLGIGRTQQKIAVSMHEKNLAPAVRCMFKRGRNIVCKWPIIIIANPSIKKIAQNIERPHMPLVLA